MEQNGHPALTAEQLAHQEKRKRILLILASIFLGIAVIYSFYWLFFGRFEAFTDDAYVNGNLVQLMPQISGTVVDIAADDTDLVLQGQPIIRLDNTDAKVALQNAEAQLGQTVRQVRQYYANVGQLQASLVLQKANLIKAQDDFTRRQGLVGILAVSREELQHAKTAVDTAQAQYNETLHQLQATNALVSGTDLEHQPMVLSAEAKLRTAYLTLQRTTLVAPVTGYIANRDVQLGQQVNPGSTLLVIVPLRQIWVDANFKESQLREIRIGQPATVISDIYGDSVKFKGKVIGLGAGTGSIFSLLPPQNATGNWIKIVQRVPVRISLDPQQFAHHPLRIGLSTEVTVNIHNRTGKMLATTASLQSLYQTFVYNQQLNNANLLIAKIIHDNTV